MALVKVTDSEIVNYCEHELYKYRTSLKPGQHFEGSTLPAVLHAIMERIKAHPQQEN